MSVRGNRFAALTDAAIDLLADRGMRGLTHRAVDAQAGVPLGSTSAYFRTRKALIEAVVQRLADLDQSDLEAGRLPTGEPAPPSTPSQPPLASTPGQPTPGQPPVASAPGSASAPTPPAVDDLDTLAAGVAALLDHWLTAGRNRMLARYACLIEAAHHPHLRQILAHGAAIRIQARALLARAGAPDPEQRGDYVVACIDGLLFDRLVGAGALTAPTPGTAASREDLYTAVRTLFRAMIELPR